ncbi:ABC transporter ATP-binding protein [Halogeometricum sp. CBA1124]|uniref:ABC transporter ATP-binding protein n=1 Tax=Halogeometricum sp. CBA1124 TaxID=2668071 RepID=UPI00142A3160|nr:ABC transporter ATP-binding protein [Halogeometricum sp. CBA1124]MUV56830.1 ATP-binding cassette domain-containing protein [Halogeometricum sp. CBA1124]
MSSNASDSRETTTVSPGRRDDVALSVEGLRRSFGGITAVNGTSFDVKDGSLTGLIGPNGAGKSTTFDLVTGFTEADAGTVSLYGQDVSGLHPYQLVERGLVRTFQTPRELAQMTVEENLTIAPQNQTGENFLYSVLPGLRKRVTVEEDSVKERAREMMSLFDIEHLASERAENLSGGQRKLLALARALMTDPDVLLLDEPFAGVNPTLQERLLEHLRQLNADGYTILLIEHDMEVIMDNCEHVLVMHQGSILTQGTPDQVRNDEQVIDAYLGGSA